jgi:hypothetical protein
MPAVRTRREGDSVFASCCIFGELGEDAVLRIEGSDRSIPYFDLFYPADVLKSGMHHPGGILWNRHAHKRHSIRQDRVPLTSIAPKILDMLALPRPDYMKSPSLLEAPASATES